MNGMSNAPLTCDRDWPRLTDLQLRRSVAKPNEKKDVPIDLSEGAIGTSFNQWTRPVDQVHVKKVDASS